MNYLEITGVVVGLLYLWLEYRASAWLWLAGIIMPAIYIFVYYDAGLYADLWISVYYILASVYGGVCWLKYKKSSVQSADDNVPSDQSPDDINNMVNCEKEDNSGSYGIVVMSKNLWAPLGLLTVFLTILIGFLLSRFTDSTVPWADGFTTALSIVAMWMLARKYLQQWILWIVADVACTILYLYKGLWFTGGLYLLYSVIAWFGYRKWQSSLS